MKVKGWWLFCLTLVAFGLVLVVEIGRTFGAEKVAPPAPEAPGPKAGAPEAAPVAPPPPPSQPSAEPAPAKEQAPETSVLEMIGHGGWIGHSIIFLSFVALALVIEHAVAIRRDKLVPPELASELEDYFNEEQYEEALELCGVERNLLTDVVRAGLSHVDAGFDRMQEAMQAAGEEAATNLQVKISYLSLIGNIAPMLGLLGTVDGMIGAFNRISQMAVVRPSALAKYIFEALVTTEEGLIVAIPVLSAFHFFANRVNRLIIEASTIVTDLMERFRPSSK